MQILGLRDVPETLEICGNQMPGKCCLILVLARRFPAWPWKFGGTGWNNNGENKNCAPSFPQDVSSCCSSGAPWITPRACGIFEVLKNLEYSCSCYLSLDLSTKICFNIQDSPVVPYFPFPSQWEKLWDGAPSFPVLVFPRKTAQGCCHSH